MQRASSLVSLACVLFLTPHLASAQDHAWIAVETNATEALLYADDVLLGSAASMLHAISAGPTRIRLVLRDAGSWSAPAPEVLVNPSPGDTVHAKLYVPYRYRINSVPFGSAVYLAADSVRGEPLGETPLDFHTDSPIEGRLVVRRDGYHPVYLEPGSAAWNHHSVVLEPLRPIHEAAAATELEWRPPGRRRGAWLDYASIGLGAAAAVIAVHYKFKADRLYDQFQKTGDLSLRAPIERYDQRSGAALIAMQAGLTVFAIRLILR